MSNKNSIFILTTIVILSIAFRLIIFQSLTDEERMLPDSPGYIDSAKNNLIKQAFLNANNSPEINRTPGYPLFLAGCLLLSKNFSSVIFFQNIISLLAGICVFFWVQKVGLPVPILSSALILFNFQWALYSSLFLSEIFFSFIFLIFIFFFHYSIKKENPLLIAISAIVGGMTVLIRPISLYFFIFAIIYIFIISKKKKFFFSIIFLSSFLILPITWMSRNFKQAGVFTLSSVAAYNLLFYQAADSILTSEKNFSADNRNEVRKKIFLEAEKRLESLGITKQDPKFKYYQNKVYKKMAIEIVQSHPSATLKNLTRNFLMILFGNSHNYLKSITFLNDFQAKTLSVSYSLFILILSILGAKQLWKAHRDITILFMVIITYFTLLSVAAGSSDSRFKIPFEPFLSIFSAYYLFQLKSWFF